MAVDRVELPDGAVDTQSVSGHVCAEGTVGAVDPGLRADMGDHGKISGRKVYLLDAADRSHCEGQVDGCVPALGLEEPVGVDPTGRPGASSATPCAAAVA